MQHGMGFLPDQIPCRILPPVNGAARLQGIQRKLLSRLLRNQAGLDPPALGYTVQEVQSHTSSRLPWQDINPPVLIVNTTKIHPTIHVKGRGGS